MNELTQAELYRIMDQAVREITDPMTPLSVCPGESPLSSDVCTIQTTFEGGYQAYLTLRADTALLIRLAKQELEEETVTREDLEDFAKEYFNVICGRITAQLFRAARITSRFRIPSVRIGAEYGARQGDSYVLRYASGHNEGIQLIHQGPPAVERPVCTMKEGAESNG